MNSSPRTLRIFPTPHCLAFPRHRFLGALVLVAAAAGGCNDPVGPGLEPGPRTITGLPRSLTALELDAIRASNEFGLDLLREVASDEPSRSIFLSPLSASMALGMTMNGASGETFEAMRDALRLEGLDEAEINASYRGLLDLLTGLDPDVDLAIGNAIWHRDDLTVREDFRDRVETAFDACVQGLDFGSQGAAEVINDWASSATRGRIEKMVDPPIPGNVLAYLMNAVYFKGGWTQPFDSDLIAAGPFYLADGSVQQVDLMMRDDTLRYHVASGYSAVDLPYAGQAFSMTILVPDVGTPLDVLVEELRVDEEGTEAAAVTSVIMIDSAPPQVRADRPFLFAIRERLSGTILFLGLIREAPQI